MNKLVTAFALCAAISAFAVESQNVVGYNVRLLDNEAGLIDAANPFINLGTAQGNWVITGSNFMGQAIVDQDTILLLNNEFLAFDSYTFAGGTWYLNNSEGTIIDQPVASITINKGDTFYAIFAGGKVVTSGQVAPSGTQNVSFARDNPAYTSGLYPFANSFPVQFTFAAIQNVVDQDTILLLNMTFLAFDSYTYAGGTWYLNNSEGDIIDQPVPSSTVCLKAGGAGYFIPAWQTANGNEVRNVSFTVNY